MVKLPSVTQILQPWSDFSGIRPEVLENAAAQGEIIHLLLSRHALGLPIAPEEITPDIAGYFNSGRQWIDKFVYAVRLVEGGLEDVTQGYQGHPDLICILKGDAGTSLWDWKRAMFQIAHAVQIGGYYGLARQHYDIQRVGCIYLRKDGKMPKIHETTKTVQQDYAVFLCALTVWRRFNP